jgi:hypothetical protein
MFVKTMLSRHNDGSELTDRDDTHFNRGRTAQGGTNAGGSQRGGHSWAMICEETRLFKGTAQRALHSLPPKPSAGLLVIGNLTKCPARRRNDDTSSASLLALQGTMVSALSTRKGCLDCAGAEIPAY